MYYYYIGTHTHTHTRGRLTLCKIRFSYNMICVLCMYLWVYAWMCACVFVNIGWNARSMEHNVSFAFILPFSWDSKFPANATVWFEFSTVKPEIERKYRTREKVYSLRSWWKRKLNSCSVKSSHPIDKFWVLFFQIRCKWFDWCYFKKLKIVSVKLEISGETFY